MREATGRPGVNVVELRTDRARNVQLHRQAFDVVAQATGDLGVSLNVLTEGEGPPVLLLHGFTGTARTWEAQIEALSPHHRVIAPDLLGHGGSDAPTESARYALDRQADDLADLLALLDTTAADGGGLFDGRAAGARAGAGASGAGRRPRPRKPFSRHRGPARAGTPP